MFEKAKILKYNQKLFAKKLETLTKYSEIRTNFGWTRFDFELLDWSFLFSASGNFPKNVLFVLLY
jgi:hypothetical protein